MSIVTFAQIKEVTGLSAIVSESRKVSPFLVEAERELRKILGVTLFDELQDAVTADFASANAVYEPLFDQVKRPLAWRTLQMSYPRLYSEATANGVHRVRSDDYEPIDSRTLAMHVAQCRDFADAGYNELRDYLKDNVATFPSYETNVGREERVDKIYTGGVVTRRSRWQNPYGLPRYGEGNRNQYGECCDE